MKWRQGSCRVLCLGLVVILLLDSAFANDLRSADDTEDQETQEEEARHSDDPNPRGRFARQVEHGKGTESLKQKGHDTRQLKKEANARWDERVAKEQKLKLKEGPTTLEKQQHEMLEHFPAYAKKMEQAQEHEVEEHKAEETHEEKHLEESTHVDKQSSHYDDSESSGGSSSGDQTHQRDSSRKGGSSGSSSRLRLLRAKALKTYGWMLEQSKQSHHDETYPSISAGDVETSDIVLPHGDSSGHYARDFTIPKSAAQERLLHAKGGISKKQVKKDLAKKKKKILKEQKEEKKKAQADAKKGKFHVPKVAGQNTTNMMANFPKFF